MTNSDNNTMGEKTFKYDKILCRKFGIKVKDLRIGLGMKQDELAFNASISSSYISAIERGITDVTISTAKRLAKALKVEISDLF